MKKRRISLAVTITAIIVVGAAAGAYFLTQTSGDFGAPASVPSVPIYPDAQESTGFVAQAIIQSQELPSSWSGKVYTTSDSTTDVLNWYREQMVDWENYIDNSGTLVYTKGNDAAMIEVITTFPIGTTIEIYQGSKSGLENLV